MDRDRMFKTLCKLRKEHASIPNTYKINAVKNKKCKIYDILTY